MEDNSIYHPKDVKDLDELGELLGMNISMDRQIVPYATKNIVIAYGTFLTGVSAGLHITILVALARLIGGGGMGLNKHLLAVFSASQLFSVLFVVPFEIAREYLGHWYLGATFCKIWITYSHLFIPAMLWSLLGLTLDKIYDLRSMGVYKYSKKNYKTAGIIACICLFTSVGLVPHQVWIHTKVEFVLVEVCAVIVDKPYTTILSFVFYFIPGALLLACLLGLVAYARHRVTQLTRAERQESLTALDPRARCRVHEEQCRTSHDVDTYISDIKNSCVCLCILSFICVSMWSPFYAANLWLSHSRCENTFCFDPRLWALFQWIGYTSCLVCPCVVFIDKRVRGTVRYWLRLDIDDGEFSYKDSASSKRRNSSDASTSLV